ncbi:hypothetical protein BDR26DRAFT_516389 [Obelidium mucronatum]|nr:hypothetical protein BDR26DRAFT_516389 [Obelidium mucronatum]
MRHLRTTATRLRASRSSSICGRTRIGGGAKAASRQTKACGGRRLHRPPLCCRKGRRRVLRRSKRRSSLCATRQITEAARAWIQTPTQLQTAATQPTQMHQTVQSLASKRRERVTSKSRSQSRDPHRPHSLAPIPDLASPLALGLRKVRPGAQHLRIETNHLPKSPSSGELPPLPRSPAPKYSDTAGANATTTDDENQRRSSVPSPTTAKPAKLKVISPTTGAAVTVADTDLLKPRASTKSRPHSVTRSPTSQRNSVVSTGGGERKNGEEVDEIRQEQSDVADAEKAEKEEEEDRIRELLSTSAAVTSHKKGKGRGSGALSGTPANVLARAAENNVAPVIESGDPDILFVDEGGKFRHLKRYKAGDGKSAEEDSRSFDEQLQRLCVGINTSCSHILQTAHGVHAGLCLFSLALFPITIPILSPFDNSYTAVEAFVAFYSRGSVPVSRLFSVLGTASVLATLDGGIDGMDGVNRVGKWWKSHHGVSSVGAVRWWRRKSGRAKRIAGFLAVIFACVSYICSIVIIHVDDRLYESQVGEFGGIYGQSNWFVNASTISVNNGEMFNMTISTRYNITQPNTTFADFYPLAGSDIEFWQNMNCARGVFGASGWMFCCVSRMMVARRKGKKEAGTGSGGNGNSGFGFKSLITRNDGQAGQAGLNKKFIGRQSVTPSM